ncbi:MAG: DUF3365 domain-containing protein [Flavobacteriales bacterium]|nr:DUF3365 domain-containing protein [Flavobacteriales bacterium]
MMCLRSIRTQIALLWVPFLLFCGSSCSNKQVVSEAERKALMDRGAEVVGSAQTELGSALQQQLKDSGVLHAIAYCNEHAAGITAGVSERSGHKVYRRSLKYRNPLNKPSDIEKNALKVFEYALEHEQPLHPLLQWNEADSSFLYFAPIVVQPMCLNCHGTRDNGLAQETFERIISLYPKDKAFNYEAGQLRGMWVVEL